MDDPLNEQIKSFITKVVDKSIIDAVNKKNANYKPTKPIKRRGTNLKNAKNKVLKQLNQTLNNSKLRFEIPPAQNTRKKHRDYKQQLKNAYSRGIVEEIKQNSE